MDVSYFVAVCGVLLVGVNVGALWAVRRDRTWVQRGTGYWLAANLVLVGAGLGVPMAVGMLRAAVAVFSGEVTTPVVPHSTE